MRTPTAEAETPTRDASSDGHPVLRAAVAGVVAGGVTLGVAEVVAALVNPSAAPVLAVGDAFVDLTPGWLKNLAIGLFGTNDKLALLVGTALVVTALAALAGVVARRRRGPGTALVVALGLVAAVAAATRPGASYLDVLPSLVGTFAGVIALGWLLERTNAEPGQRLPSRRVFLAASGVAAGTAVVTGASGRLLGGATRDVTAARARLDLPAAADAARAVPAGTSLDVGGISPWQTPNPDFYRIDTALTVPRVDPAQWRLRVHGLVEEEVEIDFAELLGADLLERWVTLACVSNEVGGDLVGNAKWLGMPVRELLARARPTDGADMVLSTSADGFTASTPLTALTDERDALLAVAMNDEPLPLEHGFPVRMVVPGLYGFVSATKWVVDLEVTTFAERTAYWTDRGWSEKGPIKVASRIDVPGSFERLKPGRVAVAGVAWAQHRGIERVEVSVDGGKWADARLAATVGPDTWRQWVWEWDAIPGQHTLRVRATDADGTTQPEERVDPIPDGATGWHSVVVRV